MMAPQDDLITIPAIEDVTRRQFMSSAFAAALLIACGNDEDTAPSEDATRTIDSVKGPVVVPARPSRIVALDPYASLQVLDEIGAPLIAAGSLPGGLRAMVSSRAEALPSIGVINEINLEAVAAANPDLIIASRGVGEPVYAQLSEIAPTVITDMADRSWREIALLTADAVNERAKVESALAELDARIETLNQQIAAQWPQGMTVSVLRIRGTDGTLVSYGTRGKIFVGSEILSQLPGVTVTADVLAPDKNSIALSAERTRDADADVILYYLGGGAAVKDSAALERSFTTNPLYSTLNAAATGRVHQVDSAWFDGSSINTAHLILDELSQYLVD